jgi:hypothetical protein
VVGKLLFAADVEIVELSLNVLVAISKSSSSIITSLGNDQTDGAEVGISMSVHHVYLTYYLLCRYRLPWLMLLLL